MTFILGTLILLSRSWSKRERSFGLLEARYAEALLKYRGSKESVDIIAKKPELNELAAKMALARGRSESEGIEALRTDLKQILTK